MPCCPVLLLEIISGTGSLIPSSTGTKIVQLLDSTDFKVLDGLNDEQIRNAYAKKKGLDNNAFRLAFDGNRISDDDTPESVSESE